MNTIKDRLLFFIKNYTKMGQNKFEKFIGITIGNINKIKNGISTTTVEKIFLKYPELILEWLIIGEGNMLKAATSDGGDILAEIQKLKGEIDNWKDKYMAVLEENRELNKENNALKKALLAGGKSRAARTKTGG
jgi:hypothetical protein